MIRLRLTRVRNSGTKIHRVRRSNDSPRPARSLVVEGVLLRASAASEDDQTPATSYLEGVDYGLPVRLLLPHLADDDQPLLWESAAVRLVYGVEDKDAPLRIETADSEYTVLVLEGPE